MKKIYKKIRAWQESLKTIDMKAVKVAASVAALFVLVWVIYAFHISDFSLLYRGMMEDVIKLQTEKESENTAVNIGRRCAVIGNVAKSINVIDEKANPEEYRGIMQSAMDMINFDSVIFIDMKGAIYTISGYKITSYDSDSLTDKCRPDKGYVCFNNTDDFFLKEPGFGVIAPIKKENVVVGYLVGFTKYSKVVDDANVRNDLMHDEVILDETGQVIVVIDMEGKVAVPKETSMFFDECQKYMTVEGFNSFATEYNECIAAGVAGATDVNLADTKQKFIYYPIADAPGWSVMNCYTESVLKQQMNRIKFTAVMIFFVIVCIMVLAAYILIKYLNGEKEKLNRFAYLDGLTGVYNRNAFVETAEKILKENSNLPYYMICFDVVNFRIINETYGHERSDNIIIEMANACKNAFGHNEVYGRLTADVFVALTLDDGEEGERISLIESMVAEEAKKHYINHPIKIKRGRYEVSDLNETIDRMIDKANIARKYVDLNRNALVCQYSESLLNDAKKTEEIESKMESALANGEFKPFIQAKFNMVENKVSGGEALVRWIRPDGSIVPPGDFIPLFERNGFVEKIDFYVLEEICKYLRKMLDENREVYKISVNQSRYLMNDPEYVAKVKDILLKYQIPIGLIELELTETVFFHEKDRMIKMMNDLKLMNVDLSIDDFGSGYSSFNILKDVPFDVLKIDREFLTESVHTEKGTWILKEIIEMAHGLGMSVICEGVETKEQIDLLVSLNCHYAQGFYYSRPIPIDEFIEKFNVVKAS